MCFHIKKRNAITQRFNQINFDDEGVSLRDCFGYVAEDGTVVKPKLPPILEKFEREVGDWD